MDVASVRGLYSGLSDGWTYLNAHDTPQIAERVAAGVARAFRMSPAVAPVEAAGGSHSAPVTAGRLERTDFIATARMAIADLTGAHHDAVVLGPSLPVLYSRLAANIQPLLRRNSSVVLQRLDSASLLNLPADIRWAQPDLGTGELPSYQFTELVDGSTRLVSFTAAHATLGAVTEVQEITDIVRDASRAWSLVDVSALATYRPIDIEELGADVVGIDLAQLGGPEISALVFRDSTMFKRLSVGREQLESRISAGLAGGVGPLVDHFAQLGDPDDELRGSRRTRLRQSMQDVAGYMRGLADELYLLMGTLSAVHILGVTGEAAAAARTDNRIPRLSFAVQGVPAETVHQRLFGNNLVTTLTPRSELLTEMGADDIGGAVTVSLSPFNTHQDIEHLIRVVASLA
ncbi:aminotransferase class V-fold PLP-dependent enzyme [Corynebacterium sp. L4756]|uniref:aminotransferase class V-fold PLP-dependent enzyme n=1 Tax=unclassified Corynebacterium TaxID=2624378 RepID=UPI00374CAA65